MSFLKLVDGVELDELEYFGFKDGVFTRTIHDVILYQVVVTRNHKYIQIKNMNCSAICSSLQLLIYNLTKANLVEEVED